MLPKVFSDILEAIIGAIYIDSSGDLDICWDFLERIGLVKLMNRFAATYRIPNGDDKGDSTFDMRHPITVWGEWTALRETTFGYFFDTSAGKTRCTLVADQEVVGVAEAFGKGSTLEDALKLACTENALTRLSCRKPSANPV